MRIKTEQEQFWEGQAGDDYIERNSIEKHLPSRTNLWAKILSRTRNVNSVIEFGANIGLNVKPISLLFPNASITALEINRKAVDFLNSHFDISVLHESLYDYNCEKKFDLVVISTVLIHIKPEDLDLVYKKLYNSASKYILINEYYNPTPVNVNYRGTTDIMFKRDFAGEMLDKFGNLELVDYGFFYHRDSNFPLDDMTWFLLEKK